MKKYAIIELYGLQYWLEDGFYFFVLNFEKILYSVFLFTKILFFCSKKDYFLGCPYVLNFSFKLFGSIIKKHFNKKILIYKMHSKKHYRKKIGIRKKSIQILSIFF